MLQEVVSVFFYRLWVSIIMVDGHGGGGIHMFRYTGGYAMQMGLVFHTKNPVFQKIVIFFCQKKKRHFWHFWVKIFKIWFKIKIWENPS